MIMPFKAVCHSSHFSETRGYLWRWIRRASSCFSGLEGLLHSFHVSDVPTFLVAVIVIRHTYKELTPLFGQSDTKRGKQWFILSANNQNPPCIQIPSGFSYAPNVFHNTFIVTVTKALVEGSKVQLLGFGVFGTRERNARKVRNPRTGESIDLAASTVPYFKPGKILRDVVKSINHPI